CTIWHNNAYIF
nr:immunoglobulin light chain junction region [Macaca mulatta]